MYVNGKRLDYQFRRDLHEAIKHTDLHLSHSVNDLQELPFVYLSETTREEIWSHWDDVRVLPGYDQMDEFHAFNKAMFETLWFPFDTFMFHVPPKWDDGDRGRQRSIDGGTYYDTYAVIEAKRDARGEVSEYKINYYLHYAHEPVDRVSNPGGTTLERHTIGRHTDFCYDESIMDPIGMNPEQFMKGLFIWFMQNMQCLLRWLDDFDHYPVNVVPVDKNGKQRQNSKAHDIRKKPYENKRLTTIIFLNALPVEKKPHQGGTHSSPVFHKRRAHKRTLKSERFKNHPQYLVYQGVSIKPMWIGEKSATYQGAMYTVWLPKDDFFNRR